MQGVQHMQDSSAREYADITPSAPAGEWMDLQAASIATGLSLATLRRYIKRKSIKGRRTGRTSNAKLEVFVTPDLASDKDRVSTDGLEDILTGDVEEAFEELDDNDQADQAVQATRETLEWMRERIDNKDEKIDELRTQLDQLSAQLTAASYRNGYLESQQGHYEDKIKLLTMQPEPEQKHNSWWVRFASWFVGKKA
jgi:bacterioferritin (cytochrome b1)